MKEQLIFMGFIIGLIFCATYTNKSLTEGFNNGKSTTDEFDCPNLLVRRGNKLMLLIVINNIIINTVVIIEYDHNNITSF